MSNVSRPGEARVRLARLIEECVARTGLDLSGTTVLTEAASGPYSVTPVIAAFAGADVMAVTANSRYGSAEDVTNQTYALAELLGVGSKVTVSAERSAEMFAAADVITNSGHLRPIVGDFARAIRSDAVVALMFEKWEFHAGRVDLDLTELTRRAVLCAGTNERHPDVDVFSYLGAMAVAQLADAGVAAYRGRIVLYCNNPFREYIERGLKSAGAHVVANANPDQLSDGRRIDAIVVATTPGSGHALGVASLRRLAQRNPDVILCHFWGDIDREVVRELSIGIWPVVDPGPGHMGVLPSRVGPEPIVRLQTGGLKVGQILLKPPDTRTKADWEWLDV